VPTDDEIKQGFRAVSEWKEISGMEVETTSWRFSWESHHSKINNFSGFLFPSPKICKFFDLAGCHRSIELVDKLGNQAILYRESDTEEMSRHELLYIRKDLLDEYLKATKRKLVWTIWGERGFHYDIMEKLRHQDKVMKEYQLYNHIHKKIVKY